MADPLVKPPTSEEDGLNPDGSPKVKDTPPKPEDAPKFTQKDQNELAAKIRREEKDKFERAATETKRLAEEAEATKQGEFQKLADSRQKELDEVKPALAAATTELEAYKLKVSEMVQAELKELPDEVRDMAPTQLAEDKSITNPLDVLAWLPKGKALADKLNGQPAKTGAKSDPKAIGEPGDADKDRQARKDARRAYRE